MSDALLNRVLLALDERERRDPWDKFEPHQGQKPFIQAVREGAQGLEGTARENWFIAANRAGKSDAGAYLGSAFAKFGRDAGWNYAQGVQVNDRSTSGWVSALDFPTSRDTLQPKYFDNGLGLVDPDHPPFIQKDEIEEWRVSDQVLKLKNGSIIGFKSADSGRRKYQGADKDWFHMDEEHPYDIYEEATIRVGARPLNFFCTATILPPEGAASGGTSWVFPKIIQPFQEGRLSRARVFGASIYDNPHIPQHELRRLEAMHPEGSVSRRIRMEGEWLPGMVGARAYSGFDRTVHVMRADDKREAHPRRPLIWTWDFNVQPMTSLVGQLQDDCYYVFREFFLTEGNIADMCEAFYSAFPNHGSEIWLYGDATANARTGQTGRSSYWMILQEMKQYGRPIRMKVPAANPKVGDRVNAVNRLMRDEHGRARLMIDSSCQELMLDLEGVVLDHTGKIKKITNQKDPYFWRGHISDALGYWIAFEEPVRPPSQDLQSFKLPPPPNYGFNSRK